MLFLCLPFLSGPLGPTHRRRESGSIRWVIQVAKKRLIQTSLGDGDYFQDTKGREGIEHLFLLTHRHSGSQFSQDQKVDALCVPLRFPLRLCSTFSCRRSTAINSPMAGRWQLPREAPFEGSSVMGWPQSMMGHGGRGRAFGDIERDGLKSQIYMLAWLPIDQL